MPAEPKPVAESLSGPRVTQFSIFLSNRVGALLDVVRVLINQAHTFGNGGSFDNGLNFTLSMGCGTWGGNSITENLNYRHFLNITHLVTTIPEDKPDEAALFGAHWAKYGK